MRPPTGSQTIEISSDLAKLNTADIQTMLARTFWAPDITVKEIEKGIRHSALSVGAYLENGRQIGFLRVISDKVRFAYIPDVVVSDEYRRQGIGRRMVEFALAHPDLSDVYQWLLVTRDAHGVYAKCGFQDLVDPELWMSIMKPRPDRGDFQG